MGKKTDTTEQPNVESGVPAYVEELLNNGTAVLRAYSREELAEEIDKIPAECTYRAGAVGFNPETRLYSIRIYLTKKE